MSDEQLLFVGVDVGGTNIKIGIVDDEGRTVAKTKFPTMADKEPSLSFEKAKESIDKLLADAGRTICLLYTSPSPRDLSTSRMPSSA